jgi:hypothetical protein
VAKNNQRDPNLRAATVARVNQLVKGGLTKASAFEKISGETGRAKDAVQMLYYRAIRADKTPKAPAKGGPKAASKPKAASTKKAKRAAKAVAAPKAAPAAAAKPAAPVAKPARRRRRSRKASASAAPRSIAQSGDFPTLLGGIASAINALLKHVEKTVEENKTLKQQAQRLQAIANLIRGK